MKLFVTGRPGVGKSTVFRDAVELLRERGLVVRGISTPEVRGSRGPRIGFDVVDLSTGERAPLARVDAEGRPGLERAPRVGRYLVDVEAFESVARPALRGAGTGVEPSAAAGRRGLIAVDEVGKMEMYSPWFAETWRELLASDADVLAVVGRAFVADGRASGEVVDVTEANRDALAAELAGRFGG
jgi:nucleoside-triphosphatase